MSWLLELVGWAGSALLVWSLLQTRIVRLRALNLVGCVILIGYNTAVGVWPMVGLNVVLAVINIVYLYKLLTTRHDQAAYQVVRVRTDDEFLAHTLRVHNTLVWRTEEFLLAPGEQIFYEAVNRPTAATYFLLPIFGIGPLYVTLRRMA